MRDRPGSQYGWRYRASVLSRLCAAVFGGYALAAVFTVVLSTYLPQDEQEAVLTGTMLSFLVYALAVMWVFAARDTWRAWAGVMVPTVLLAATVVIPRWAGA
jgi:hypothetical protein